MVLTVFNFHTVFVSWRHFCHFFHLCWTWGNFSSVLVPVLLQVKSARLSLNSNELQIQVKRNLQQSYMGMLDVTPCNDRNTDARRALLFLGAEHLVLLITTTLFVWRGITWTVYQRITPWGLKLRFCQGNCLKLFSEAFSCQEVQKGV